MIIYATTGDLEQWVSPAPANAAALLRSASILVRTETMTAVYETTEDGAPTEPRLVEAFRDATCAQVRAWNGMGVDPSTAGVPSAAPVKSKKLGSGGFEYDTSVHSSVTAFQAKREAAAQICIESVMILQQAGLTPGGVRHG
ncbi:hypothetical protein [Arthrobacter sp. YN]|uniref:hypothetical protein n=1 Tax=Arthrobacter sp. YN TaxID=2020486 RepID=UPI000B5E9829|nr:hypothetical protein [Arthrobacter sp. YN]ASN20698.1 hypothetical protein CGK93_14175 [Arthrobacter sp. YN]